MAIYLRCPRPDCEGEVEFRVVSDSDESGLLVSADAEFEECSEGHILDGDEWASIQSEADKQAVEYWRTCEPSFPA